MKQKITSEFFKEYTNVRELNYNGESLFTYVQDTVDLSGDKYISNLYLYDMTTNQAEQLTDDGKAHMHQWLDEENLLIAIAREEKDKAMQEKGIPLVFFYQFNVHTKTYTKLFKVFKNVYKCKRIANDRYLLLASESPMRDAYLEESDGDWDKYLDIIQRESNYFVADEAPFWTDAGGYSNKERGRVYLYDHGQLTRLTGDDISVYDIDSYQDQYGLFYGVESGGMQRTEGKVYRINYADMKITAIDESNTYIYTKIQAIDQRHILLCRNDRKFYGEYQNEYIDILDMETGSFTRNNKNADFHLYDNVISDIGYLSGWLNKITVTDESIIFIALDGGSSRLFRAKPDDDNAEVLTKADGKILDYFLFKDADGKEQVFMSAMRGLGGGEFYILDLQTGEETRLSTFNTHIQEAYNFPQLETCHFINRDGIEIHGWVMKPVGFDAENADSQAKYPAILFIHGGPDAAYGEVVSHDMMLLAQQGYAAFYCNPRGSEGRGREFADIRLKWGDVDYKDFMEFTDTVLKRYPWIDENRLGVTGGSYGGIMTNWIVGHTDRFKAAISDRSVSNLISDYGLSDIGFPCNIDIYGVTPWEDLHYLWDNSALKYAKNIKAPILFIHGMADYRCPWDNALQLHSAITYFGGTSKVIGFKDETHELCRSGSPQNRVRRLDEMVKWFKKYL